MKKEHRRLFAFIFVAIILLTFQLAMDTRVSAAEGINNYGSSVVYAPKALNAGGKELMFFDYDMAHYNAIKSKSTAGQLNYLETNKLSLNKFGAYQSSSSYGDVDAPNTFKGYISNNDKDEDFKVYYDFRSLLVGGKHGYTSGNIKTMLEKGDLSFAFAYKVYVRYYDKDRITYTENRSSISEVTIFNSTTRETGTDGNRWEFVNYTDDDKLNLSSSDTWKSGSGNSLLMSYYGSSYGGPVHTEMQNGVLVGKDSKGPSIKTVNVSSKIDGPWQYKPDGTANDDWKGIDAITDEDIGKTVYIGVIFDEPVKFNEEYDTPEELAKLNLVVKTQGKDGSDAMDLHASFLKYAPDANTSAPVMIFEYQIQDPNSESSKRNDLYYKLLSVNVDSSKQNHALFNCLTDMAGNKFNEKNGRQSNYSIPVSNKSGSTVVVDFQPLIIESATITRGSDSTDECLTLGESISITLNLNKILDNWSNMPDITLNIKDGSGEYIKPRFRSVSIKDTQESLHYAYNLPWGTGYSAEGPIRIQSISIAKGDTVIDESGYLLTIPETMPAFDKNYYLDFNPPVVKVDITKEAENIFKITANVEDLLIRGRDAVFSVYTDWYSSDPLLYQVSTDGSYDNDWDKTAGEMTFSVNAPLVPPDEGNKKNAYLFIKLPDNVDQMTRLSTTVYVTDATGYTGTGHAGYSFNPPFDNIPPEVELIRQYKIDGFSVMLIANDYGAMTYRYAWLEGHDAALPSTWMDEGPILGYDMLEYGFKDNGMIENDIYYRTLWVEVEDKSGNITAKSLNFTYNNMNSEIYVENISPVNTGVIIKDENLSATVSFKHATEYAYTWIEWGSEFERDDGAYFKSMAATYFNGGDRNVFKETRTTVETTTTEAVTFTLDSDTPVWRNYNKAGQGYSYGEDSAGQAFPREISGPIVLVICGRYNDGSVDRYTFEFIPFNTRYGVGNYEVQQVRFSTNGADGKRIDRVYDSFINYSGGSNLSYGYGLYYPEKPGTGVLNSVNLSLPFTGAEGVNPTALNFTPLNDFAEAEFVLRDDPALGLESLKLTGETDRTKVLLKKVTFQSDGSMEYSITGDSVEGYDYSFWFKDESKKSEEVLETWYLTEEMLTLAEGNSRIGGSKPKSMGNDPKYLLDYSFTLPIDVSLITPNAYDEAGNLIRYEFWIEYAYQDHYNLQNKSEILTMFAFENRIPELLFKSVNTGDMKFGESHQTIPANLATTIKDDDIQIIDKTVSAHRVFFSGDDPKLMLKVDIPDNAFNMLNNYSISVERLSESPITFTPGHHYRLLYGTAEGLDMDGQSFRINGEWAECEDGSFTIDLKNLVASGGTLTEGETMTIYYQLVKEDTNKISGEYPGDAYQPIKRYSPVYRIDLIRDEIPPIINLHVSETEATNHDVKVIIQGVRDGHMVNKGLPDEYYIMDTPAQEILISVSAKYEDGETLQPIDGAYIFSRNGSIEVTAIDKAGNEAKEIYVVNNIDREPPVVAGSPVINSENGSFTINATITGGDAVEAYITFDAEYTAHLSGGADSNQRFPAEDSEAYGIFMKKGISGGEDDSIELLIYAKSGVPLSSAILHVIDAAGNVGELPFDVNINGIVPTVTNTDKIYSYGEALTFSGPVRLIDPVDSKKDYATSHENLPIYTDGPVGVSYIDIFGRSYYEQITANIFGEAYAHDLTITPAGPTNGSVTVKVDTSSYHSTVQGGEDENYKIILKSENGNVKYTIVPDGAMPKKEFSIPINNIDKTPPKAFYTRTVNGEESFDAEGKSTITGSVTYTILGFDEKDAAMDEGEAINVTFTDPGEHIFRFTDAAGNKGELIVSETGTTFLPLEDLTIAKFKLTYTLSGEGTSPVQLGQHYSDEATLALMTTNRNISVFVQAINAAGDVIPAVMGSPAAPAEGVQYFTGKNTLIFTKNTATTVVLKTSSGSQKSVTITIPEGTIDKVLPTGTVEYVMLKADETLPGGITFQKGTVKAYLITEEKDIEVSGPNVRQDSDGKYYIHFAENGNGKFYMTDKAGNTGILMAGAYGIDNTPPGIKSESWYSSIAAKPEAEDGTSGNSKEDVLSTMTNNSIRLFFIFDELIRNVDITVYSPTGVKIPSEAVSSYISYTHSANTLNIEFKQNCQAKISVFDIRGNETVLLRPEDGPLTVIDKKAPTYTVGTPVVANNIVSINYSFDEEVASANEVSEYKTEHKITFNRNGVYSLTFADKAGNVATIITNIDKIDDQSPAIFYALKIVPDTGGVLYSDEAKTQPIATNGNLEIAIVAEDVNDATIQVFNQNKPGTPLTLVAPTINDGATKTYTHAIIAEENGVYRVSATDKYGNNNTVFVRISFIDKEAPSIFLESTKALPVSIDTEPSELSSLLLEGVSAKDDREGDVTSKVTVDITSVDLSKEGIYTAVYQVKDELNNTATRERKVAVSGSSLHSLIIAGKPVAANDIYVATPGNIAVTAPTGYTLCVSEGFKTRAQMKYAPSLNGSLKAINKGYYTILAQSGDRDAFIVYVYVY